MTLNGVTTADARYLCGSWASCKGRTLTKLRDGFNVHTSNFSLKPFVRLT